VKKESFLIICEKVADLAWELMQTRFVNFEEYQCIKLNHNFLKDISIWQMTFKHISRLPNKPDERIAFGGEVFIEVNLATGKANIIGYGE
jgi:hypothetical protein